MESRRPAWEERDGLYDNIQILSKSVFRNLAPDHTFTNISCAEKNVAYGNSRTPTVITVLIDLNMQRFSRLTARIPPNEKV